VAIYLLSFSLPPFAIGVQGERAIDYGYWAFVIGFASPLAGPFFGGLRAFAPWVANPILWFGIYRFVSGQYGAALLAGVLATLMSATLLFGEGDQSLFLAGYSMWLLSMAMFTLVAAIGWRSSLHVHTPQEAITCPSHLEGHRE
jgi:hypothetical protein